MYVSRHVIFGFLFSLVLYLVFPQITLVLAIIIFFSSFLIDVDHYIRKIYVDNVWSLNKSYKESMKETREFLNLPRKERNKFPSRVFFLHGIEPLIIFLVLGYFYKYFLYIAIGFGFHLILDIPYQLKFQDKLEKVSVIYDYLNSKTK
jgi:hypothetical protein